MTTQSPDLIDDNRDSTLAINVSLSTSSTSPGVPTGLTAIPGDSQITLEWIAPGFDGGQSIDYYIVYQAGEALPDHIVGLAAIMSDLINGWTYSFTVAAHNAAGTGPQSDPVTAIPFTTPSSGSFVRFYPGDGQVTISWQYPEYDGGSPIIYYIIYQDGVDIIHTSENAVTITGLTNGQNYYFAVAAHNAAGDSPQRGATLTPIGAPDAPTGLSGTPGNGQVFLTWTAPINNGGAVIDSYNVYQDGVGVMGTMETFITITGLTNGRTYNFSISATNNFAVEGPQTSAVKIIPSSKVTVPGVPTGLTATPGDGRIELSWSVPGSNGGATINYYVVYQNNTDIKHVTGYSWTITGLTNGRPSSFSIAAHNSAGTGARSSAIQETPYTVPDAPTGFVAISGNGQVTLKWNAPSFNGGRAIDYYIVYQDGVALSDHPNGTTTIISGLVKGQIYSFTVSAHNLAGIGPRSIASPSTPYSSPDAPTGLKAVPDNAQAILNWTAPVFDGGQSVDYFIIYQDGNALADHPTGLTAVITGLTNGRTYSFTVTAHNAVGTGPESGPITVTPFTTPGSVKTTLFTSGNAQATLSWSFPENNGGSPIIYYIIYQDGVDIIHTSEYTATITGLTNGQAYGFAVAAHNAAGNGSQVGTTLIPITIPDPPTGPSVIPGNAEVILTWSVPGSNGGAAIDFYIVYQDGAAVKSIPETNTSITGLTNGQTYNFAIAAQNAAGIGPKTSEVMATPNPTTTVPGVPTGLTATPGDGRIELSWTSPVSNGGATIDQYVVYQDEINIDQIISNYMTITGLTNGRSYAFSVAAHNSAGTGPRSVSLQAIPCTIPSAPTALTAAPGNAFVTLNWAAPSNDGGSAIDYYAVKQNGAALSNDPTGLSCIIAGLTNGQSYNFAVAAHNSAGVGPYSYVTASPIQTVPSQPMNVSSSKIDSGIVLAWSVPADDGGYSITYEVFRGTSKGSESSLVSVSGNSYSDKAMVLGTNYYYYVKATNQLGSSVQSDEIGPISASAVIVLEMETESSFSSIGVMVIISGEVRTAGGGMPIAGLNINVSHSIDSGQTWIELSSVPTSPIGKFSTQWTPNATGVYLLRGCWVGNATYQTSNSILSLAVASSGDRNAFTVQSNSTISGLSFNSLSKELRFNVSGDPGTYGYSQIVISKELVANGSEIQMSMDRANLNYQLGSTDSSWILYFTYNNSTHSIVANLNDRGSGVTNNDSSIFLIALAGVAAIALVAGLVVVGKRKHKK